MSNVLRLSARATLVSLGLALGSSATIAAARPSAVHTRARLPRMAARHTRHVGCDGNAGQRHHTPPKSDPATTQTTSQAPAPAPKTTPTAPTSIDAFTVIPTQLKPGQTGKLVWRVSNVDTLAIVPAISQFTGDSAIIAPMTTTTYALNVSGPGGAALQFLTVPVVDGSAPAPVIEPVATPAPQSSAAGSSALSDDKHPAGYSLVFNDEFNGTTLDRNLWCTRYAYGGGPIPQYRDSACEGPDGHEGSLDFLNAERQRYVDTNTLGEAMHTFSAGALHLRATKTRNDSYASYEAAMIRSKLEFKPDASTSYFISARVRLPNVKGTWPALWLASGFGTNGDLEWPPEIDVFEAPLNGLDVKANMIRMGSQIHAAQTSTGDEQMTYSDPSFQANGDDYAPSRSLRATWLVIGAEWTQTGVCYFVDGVKTKCENYRWVDDSGAQANPGELLLNLAIGGDWAGAGGIDDSMFPTSFDVDYVRVYRK